MAFENFFHFELEHELSDKDIAIVTGGSAGLGLEISKSLRSNGVRTIILDISSPPVDLLDNDSELHFFRCDITDCVQMSVILENIYEKLGEINILINNAGITRMKFLTDLQDDEIADIVNIDLVASCNLVYRILPLMPKNKKCCIVTIASVLGQITPARLCPYGSSKAGQIAFHMSLEKILRDESYDHINCILICPGKINTNMFSAVRTPSDFLAPDLDAHLLGNKIVDSVKKRKYYVLREPYYVNLVPYFKFLGSRYIKLLKRFSGMDKVTDILDSMGTNNGKL